MWHRTPGANFYIPRRKSEKIEHIINTGRWKGTKTQLRDMDNRQLTAILIKFRNEFMISAVGKK